MGIYFFNNLLTKYLVICIGDIYILTCAGEKVRGINKVIRIYLLGAMDVCTKNGNSLNVSVWTKGADQLTNGEFHLYSIDTGTCVLCCKWFRPILHPGHGPTIHPSLPYNLLLPIGTYYYITIAIPSLWGWPSYRSTKSWLFAEQELYTSSDWQLTFSLSLIVSKCITWSISAYLIKLMYLHDSLGCIHMVEYTKSLWIVS